MERQKFFDGAFTVNYDSIGKSQFNVNLLAVDFGDGDIDVAGKRPDGEIGLFRIDDNQSERRPNVIATSPTLERHEVAWIASAKTRSGKQDVFYCNFKCSPKSSKFTSPYTTQVEAETMDEEGRLVTELKDRGRSSYQNGELMGLAFAEQFESILYLNYEFSNWKMDRPMVLYVGCPAGTRDPNSEWYGVEKEYGQFLMSALEEYADNNPGSYLRKYRDYWDDAFIDACGLFSDVLSAEEKKEVELAISLVRAKEKSKRELAWHIFCKLFYSDKNSLLTLVTLLRRSVSVERIRSLTEGIRSCSFFSWRKCHIEELFLKCRLPINLRVVPESNAAVAYEMNKRYGHRLGKGRIIILIDLGSSTTDFAYVNDGKLVDSLSYSRNLGGGMFEEIMLKLIQEKEHPSFTFSTSNEKIRLRFAKEDFYENGYALYVMNLGNGEQYEKPIPIMKDFMEEAVNEVPVTVAGSLVNGVDDLQCDSLKDAYRRVFKEYKERIERDEHSRRTEKPVDDAADINDEFSYLFTNNLTDTPDMIVVTGGVSKVGWVMDLIEEIFGVKPVNSKMPHASVAFGLGFVGETELKKEILVREIMGEIKEMLGGADGKIFTELRDRSAEVCLNKAFEEVGSTLRVWRDDPTPLSLNDWHAAYVEKITKRAAKEEDLAGTAMVNDLKVWWENSGLLSKLNQLLKDKFTEVFKNANGDFDFEIGDVDILTKLHSVTTISWYMDNPLAYFNDNFFTSPLRKDLKRHPTDGINSKKKCYERFKNREGHLKNDLRPVYRRMLSEGYMTDQPKQLINGVPAMQYIHDTIYSSLEDEVYRYAEYLTNFFYSE